MEPKATSNWLGFMGFCSVLLGCTGIWPKPNIIQWNLGPSQIYWVLWGLALFYLAVLGFIGFHCISSGFRGFRWDSLSFTRFLLGFTLSCWFSFSFTGFYKVPFRFIRFYEFLLGFPWFYLVSLRFSRFYWFLLRFTSLYRVWLGSTWFLFGFTRFYEISLTFFLRGLRSSLFFLALHRLRPASKRGNMKFEGQRWKMQHMLAFPHSPTHSAASRSGEEAKKKTFFFGFFLRCRLGKIKTRPNGMRATADGGATKKNPSRWRPLLAASIKRPIRVVIAGLITVDGRWRKMKKTIIKKHPNEIAPIFASFSAPPNRRTHRPGAKNR